jgi:hypothetical protein
MRNLCVNFNHHVANHQPFARPEGDRAKAVHPTLCCLTHYRTDTTRSDERPGCLSAPSRWGPLSSPSTFVLRL